MTPRRWARVAELFDAAVELPAPRRAAYLDRACGADADLRAEVEALLRHDGAGADPLEQAPLAGALADLDEPAAADLSGQRVGGYVLEQRIAAGGMGEVYLAARERGSFEQRVAVKLVRAGVDSAAARRRFRRECQALARLTHPGIARIFDGGLTADGRPYLVMEYIEGAPIDEHCASRRLPVRRRLALFREVCAAVQHAHENLIVHLDLKPTNILVTADGRPRLVDFGIARLLSPGARADATATLSRVLTPDYASPEQLRGEPLATASDVYSLGVVLFELLAGRRPYTTRGRTSAEAERIVCERDPPAPSAAVAEAPATFPTSAAQRRRELRGDLDRIVLKALRKEPQRRYRSVEQLGSDLDRYLRGMPVTAARDTWRYRVGKFIARNKAATGAAVAIAVVLAAAMAGVTWQARRAARQAAVARTEARTAQRVAGFLISLLEESDPTIAPGDLTLRELLDRSAGRLRTELAGEPAVRAELMSLVGSVYQHLGLFEEAGALLEEALAVRRARFGPRSVEVALSLNDLGVLATDRGHRAEAVERLTESVRLYERALRRGDQVLRTERERRADVTEKGLATALANLGLALASAGRTDEARLRLEAALGMIERLRPEDPRLETAALETLAGIHRRAGELRPAERLLRDALRLREQHYEPDHPLIARAMNNLGTVLLEQGRLDEAAPLLRRSLEIRRAVYGDEHPDLVAGLASLGKLCARRGDLGAAETHLAEALELAGAVLPEKHPHVPKVMFLLATVRQQRGDASGAESLLRRALQRWSSAGLRETPDAARAQAALGSCLVARGRLDEAETAVGAALAAARALPGDQRPVIAAALAARAELMLARGRRAAAAAGLAEALALREAALGPEHFETARTRRRLREIEPAAD